MNARKTKPSPGSPKWMGYEEAAAYLGIPERQLRRFVPQGKVPYTKFGNRVLFQAWQLDAFLQASTHMPEGM